jgi:hypothetical protein
MHGGLWAETLKSSALDGLSLEHGAIKYELVNSDTSCSKAMFYLLTAIQV